jgi:two-component system response regulator YesN
MKLLIVDDEPVIVRGLLQLIDYAALGYDQILSATKSTDALQILRSQRPEAMLSDIAMPGLSGLELLHLIRDEAIPTQVVFLSGFRSFEYAQEALALGAKDYLVKPVDTDKLSRDLREIAEKHQQLRTQQRLQRQLESISREDHPVFTEVRADDSPFSLMCFHLTVDQQQSSLSAGLLHFSALSKGETYCMEKGCTTFLKDDFLCALVHGSEQEDCRTKAQRICEGCSGMVEKTLSRPFNYVIYPEMLHSTQEIPEAWRYCTQQLSIPHKDQQTDDSLIERIKDYIAQHYGEDLSLDVMSSQFAMNPSYFSSFFHQKTGIKYKDYLTRIRITEAKRLLLKGDLKIYEISQQVGFTDVRYFSQVFLKATGVLPKDYKGRSK